MSSAPFDDEAGLEAEAAEDAVLMVWIVGLACLTVALLFLPWWWPLVEGLP